MSDNDRRETELLPRTTCAVGMRQGWPFTGFLDIPLHRFRLYPLLVSSVNPLPPPSLPYIVLIYQVYIYIYAYRGCGACVVRYEGSEMSHNDKKRARAAREVHQIEVQPEVSIAGSYCRVCAHTSFMFRFPLAFFLRDRFMSDRR